MDDINDHASPVGCLIAVVLFCLYILAMGTLLHSCNQ